MLSNSNQANNIRRHSINVNINNTKTNQININKILHLFYLHIFQIYIKQFLNIICKSLKRSLKRKYKKICIFISAFQFQLIKFNEKNFNLKQEIFISSTVIKNCHHQFKNFENIFKNCKSEFDLKINSSLLSNSVKTVENNCKLINLSTKQNKQSSSIIRIDKILISTYHFKVFVFINSNDGLQCFHQLYEFYKIMLLNGELFNYKKNLILKTYLNNFENNQNLLLIVSIVIGSPSTKITTKATAEEIKRILENTTNYLNLELNKKYTKENKLNKMYNKNKSYKLNNNNNYLTNSYEMNSDIYNDSYRYYDEDKSDIQIDGNEENSNNNKLNNMQRIQYSGEPSSTNIPSFLSSSSSSSLSSTSTSSPLSVIGNDSKFNEIYSKNMINSIITTSSSPVSVTTNTTNPNEQFNSYIHTNGISNSINNINLKNNISSSKNFINNKNNFDKLFENSNNSTNINSKLFSTTTTKIDNDTISIQHSDDTTTMSVLNETVYSSSSTNNILDILNDDNIVNSLIINDTFLNETNPSDITLKNSSTINSSIIDNLFNTSFNSITSYGIDTGGNYTAGYNNNKNINNNNYSLLVNKNDYNNVISSYSSISSTTLLSLSSVELDINYTPSMSQVLLAPTMSSLINYPVIPTDSTYIAMGSIANSAATGGGSSIGIPPANNGGLVTINNITETGIDSFYFYETEQFTVLWILFTVIVLGNTAVLLTLFLNKNRKSRMNFFIKQLAIADLCVGLLNVLTDIIWRITITWRAGNAACKIIRYSECCITYASTYVLVALSIDRYDAITHPMNFSGSWQRARRLVILAWIVSCIFSLPILFLYEEAIIQGQSQCWIDLKLAWKWKLYMSLISLTLFFIPTVIISGCYAIIIRTIWVKGSVFVPAERTGRNSACMASRRASSRGIIPRAKVKTVKMTFVIVIVFVMCWSPYFVYNLWEVYYQPKKTQKSIAISTFIQSLAPLNSAANPLIYCLFSTQVCRALKRVPPFRWFSCLSCCNNQTNNNSSQHRCTTVNQRLHNSCDSMRTLTTSLNVSRRSNNCMRPARVVIVERPKTILAMSEV